MNRGDAARVLAMAAAFDGRVPDETAVVAWAAALDDVEFQDAQEALVDHYRASTKWIMPADVRSRALALRRKRGADRAVPAPPLPLDVAGDLAWRRAWLRAVGAGATDEQAEQEANQAVGIDPPPAVLVSRPVAALVEQAAASTKAGR